MGKIKYLIWAIFGLSVFIFGLGKTEAAEGDIVINEVMANPIIESSGEFIELVNNGLTSVDLSGWSIADNSSTDTLIEFIKKDFGQKSGFILAPHSYALILDSDYTSDYDDFLIDHLTENSIILTTPNATLGNSLSGSSDKIALYDNNSQLIEEFSWFTDAGDNKSWEKTDPAMTSDSNWHPSYIVGGTPGAKNSQEVLPEYPPEVLELIDLEDALVKSVRVTSVTDGDTIKVSGLTGFSSTIRFLAVDSAETGESLYQPAKDFTSQLIGQNIDLIISGDESEQLDGFGRTLAVIISNNQVFNTKLLERGLASYYDTDNLVLKNAAWQAIEEQAEAEGIGLWAGAKTPSVILSELLPNPSGADGENEWIEIYNPAVSPMNLSYFLLDDYLISYGTIIPGRNWLVFRKSQTGITLNNSGDTVRLYFPDGVLSDETNYTTADEGLSWAFDSGWGWTTNVTAGAANVISSPVIEEVGGDDEEELNIPVNTTPIEIKTGEVENYENSLVKITGTVTKTSGNTFYLDDGSGKVKVYIQEAKGIEKPEMHAGDIFEIIGIVNLYRGVYRILPQRQEDIKLIKAKEDELKETAKAKTSTAAKSSTAKKTSASGTVKARAPTKIASKDVNKGMIKNQNAEVEGYKSPVWIGFMKALIGLALVFLVVLTVKIVSFKKQKISGSDFGDDYT